MSIFFASPTTKRNAPAEKSAASGRRSAPSCGPSSVQRPIGPAVSWGKSAM